MVEIMEWRCGRGNGKDLMGWLAALKWIAGSGGQMQGLEVLVLGACGGGVWELDWGGGGEWRFEGRSTRGGRDSWECVSGYSQGTTSMFGDWRPEGSRSERERDGRESVEKVGSRRLWEGDGVYRCCCCCCR